MEIIISVKVSVAAFRRDDERHHTACAAISFTHHKELFSETLTRNLP
jgi:hypothetical protein